MKATPDFNSILDKCIEVQASDIFVRPGSVLRARVGLEITPAGDYVFSEKDVEKIVFDLIDGPRAERLKQHRSLDFAMNYGDRWRFRVAIFFQRYALSMVIRKIDLKCLSFGELNMPAETLEKFCREKQGFILLTGITGSGKSTTIASMINFINKNLKRHVLTIEEPIEFTFESDKSVINQREIGSDVHSYSDALTQFTLHSPDIIYIGNIRDHTTCQAALTAAETGALVLSTMHTIDAMTTIERIVNFFPSQQHDLVFNQLSSLLKGVISLRLVPKIDTSGLIPAYEVMTLSAGISAIIREKKVWEIPKYLAEGAVHGMKSFNQCLFDLVISKKISAQTALEYSNNKEDLAVQLRRKEII